MADEANTIHWPTDDEIQQAVEILQRGGLVAFPTETVYGLGADARNAAAIEKIFAAKKRPHSHPLIVHLADESGLSAWVREIPPPAQRLAAAFWPGPLTMILPKRSEVQPLLTGGSDSLGIRIPSHPVARNLLSRFGSGIAAPSANQFKRVSPTLARHVRQDLGNAVDLVLDGGACDVGIESTIVDFSQQPPVILRLGNILQVDLERVAEVTMSLFNRQQTASPGQHPIHYSPRAKTVIAEVGELVEQAQYHISLGRSVVVLSQSAPSAMVDGITWWQLPDQLHAVAQVLYQRMHEVDEHGFDVLIMDLPPDQGIGSAIRDRIHRAAGSFKNDQELT